MNSETHRKTRLSMSDSNPPAHSSTLVDIERRISSADSQLKEILGGSDNERVRKHWFEWARRRRWATCRAGLQAGLDRVRCVGWA